MNPAIGAGTLVSIFAVPQITRNAIRQEAELAWYHSSNPKEKIFWNAVIRGCRLPL